MLFFSQQAPDLDVELILRLAKQVATTRTRKTRVNAANQAVAIDEQRCRPGIPIDQLRELCIRLVRIAAQQYRKLQPVLFYEGTQAGRILELLGLFERERNNP